MYVLRENEVGKVKHSEKIEILFFKPTLIYVNAVFIIDIGSRNPLIYTHTHND